MKGVGLIQLQHSADILGKKPCHDVVTPSNFLIWVLTGESLHHEPNSNDV